MTERSSTADQHRADPFDAVLGGQLAGSDRPEDPWAVVELHLPTLASCTAPEEVTEHLLRDRLTAARRISDIQALLNAGWQMDRPAVRLDDPERMARMAAAEAASPQPPTAPLTLRDDTHLDIDVRFRKRFPSEQAAEQEVASLRLDSASSWDLGWNEQPDGSVQWWSEAPRGA